MSEYMKANENPSLIGKRAKIKNVPDYCTYLWGHTGTIQEVYGQLSLKFDEPAVSGNSVMNSVYMTESCYELVNCPNSPVYEKLPNRCLNEQRLQKLERCGRHGRNGNIACQFCGISMYYPEKGFTCEP